MGKAEQCSVTDCDQIAGVALEGEALCRGHFISVCYTQLKRDDKRKKTQRGGVSDAEAWRRFINQCSRQADEIEHMAIDLDNLDRARLLHILPWANERGRHLGRSPRKVASIPVRLCSDKLGGAWQEETQTLLLSRHGASLRCDHTAKPGEPVHLVWLDSSKHG